MLLEDAWNDLSKWAHDGVELQIFVSYLDIEMQMDLDQKKLFVSTDPTLRFEAISLANLLVNSNLNLLKKVNKRLLNTKNQVITLNDISSIRLFTDRIWKISKYVFGN